MRIIVMLVSVVIVSLLIFKGYSSGLGGKPGDVASPVQMESIERAKNVEPLLQQAAEAQRKALEQQLQQQ